MFTLINSTEEFISAKAILAIEAVATIVDEGVTFIKAVKAVEAIKAIEGVPIV